MKSIWPRTKGQEWNIAKFHEQLHVIDDIIQNGPPAGSHSGRAEHNHIDFVKRPSERTQKRKKYLDSQIADRNHETYIIYTALQYMITINPWFEHLPEKSDNDQVLCPSNSTLKLKIKDGTKMTFYTKGSMRLCDDALDFILMTMSPFKKQSIQRNIFI